MGAIQLLSPETINQIAAGEVIERPSSVVKELLENAMDAGADAVTVDIREGGIAQIRVTDNGSGIPADEVRTAFLCHATSKLRDADELMSVQSLGFRGEALSSIAAAARTEIYTRPADQLVGIHRICDGEEELLYEEIGCPSGTTLVISDLFSHTPARLKFLRSARAEGNAVTELVERLALSRPDISFRLKVDGKETLNTSGNGNLTDVVYQIFGRETARDALPVDWEEPHFHVTGLLGTPSMTRGNRIQELFFVNGRTVASRSLSRAVEDGYEGFVMQHRFPFALLFLTLEPGYVDVNVHPAKAEVRFAEEAELIRRLAERVAARLRQREDIAAVGIGKEEQQPPRDPVAGAEPFETQRLAQMRRQLTQQVAEDSPYRRIYAGNSDTWMPSCSEPAPDVAEEENRDGISVLREEILPAEKAPALYETGGQLRFLSPEAAAQHRIIGQYLGTYWLVEYQEKLYIIDQHAAHEKVLYERKMKELHEHAVVSQQLSPPILVTLSPSEAAAYGDSAEAFAAMGYELDHFGGRDYRITAVPADFPSIDPRDLFLSVLSDLQQERGVRDSTLLTEKIASMSCKAAVKGNTPLSPAEADALIRELLSLENPYHCPHGRPTIIVMNRYEIERKFKRIV